MREKKHFYKTQFVVSYKDRNRITRLWNLIENVMRQRRIFNIYSYTDSTMGQNVIFVYKYVTTRTNKLFFEMDIERILRENCSDTVIL